MIVACIERLASRSGSRRTTRRRLLVESVEPRRLFYSGELDTQFAGGIVRTEVDASTNWSHSATDSVLQSDGKLVAVGDGGLARYLIDGSLDPQFGVMGRSSVPFTAKSMTLQSDGKILVVGTNFASRPTVNVARFLNNGALDPSFDFDGIAKVDFDFRSDIGNDVAVQSNGKIIVLATSTGLASMARLNSNGSLDLSFLGTGTVMFRPTGDETIASVAIAPNDNIVVLGYGLFTPIDPDPRRIMFVVQFNRDGYGDSSFGSRGVVGISVGDLARASSVAVGSGGNIFVAGTTKTGSSTSSVLVKLSASGQFDTTFDGDGIRIDPLPGVGDIAVTDLALQNDGRILVSARLANSGSVMRFGPDGGLDATWDGDGILNSPDFSPNSISISSSDKVSLAGASQDRFAVARLLSNGAPDIAFSLDGRTITTFGASYDLGEDVLQQPDGKLLVVGRSEYSALVLRYLANGQLDTSFSSDGKFTFDFDPRNESSIARAVALQRDGKILVAGTVSRFVGSSILRSFAIARLNVNGTLDNTFSQDGIATLDFIGDANVRSIELLADGRIVLAGTDFKSIALARFLPDGSLDTSFGQAGKSLKSFDTANLTMGSLVTLHDGRMLVAATMDRLTGSDDSQNILLVRYLSNGTIDSTFGSNGVTIALNPWHRTATAMILQPDGKILVSGNAQTTDPISLTKRVVWSVSRFQANGLPDSAFGNGGTSSFPLLGLEGVATSLALQSNGQIVVTGQGNRQPIVSRLNPDGLLDSSFAGDGLAPLAVSNGAAVASKVRVQSDGKALVLGSFVDGPADRIESDLFVARLRNDQVPTQSTMASIVDGAVLLVDQWARDDAIDIYREGGNLVIADRSPDPRAGISFVGIAGAINQSPKRISIPWNAIESTGKPLRFGLGLGDDRIQLLTEGDTQDIVPTAGLSIGMDGGMDTVKLVGNSTVNNWYLNDANRVDMQLGTLGPVWISGLDAIVGGDSSDTFALQYDGAAVIPVINGGLGTDKFVLYRDANVKLTSSLLPLGSHRLFVDGVVDQSYLLESIEISDIKGGPSDNVIDLYDSSISSVVRGGGGNDSIYGSRVNDYLYGEDGNDFISGSSGADQVFGGNGNDILMGNRERTLSTVGKART